MADPTVPLSLASRLRRRRMRLFLELLDGLVEPVRILDVGGTQDFWLNHAPSIPRRCQLTVLNLEVMAIDGLPNATSLAGDARNMSQFADNAFDVCFSNSVIEHVGTLDDQARMAAEVRRVARAYFIQTPHRHFFIEPHFLVPFWQYLPLGLRAGLHRRLKLGWMPAQPDRRRARQEVEAIRLLTLSELHTLFPEASIVPESIGPLTKSWMAVRRPETD